MSRTVLAPSRKVDVISLLDEARAVRRFLARGDLLSARWRLARIVGRDTHELDAQEVMFFLPSLTFCSPNYRAARELGWRVGSNQSGS